MRNLIGLLPQLTSRRALHSTPLVHLIYKRASKVKKAPPPMESHMEFIKSAKTVSEIEDVDAVRSLANNKFYQRTPLILKPYMRCILLRPSGFVVSIVLLQQVFSICPFLCLWYLFHKFGVQPPPIPEELLQKSIEMMDNGLVNWDDTVGDKQLAILAGANAYATVKLLSPLIWISSISFAPFFDQYVIRSLTRVFKRLFSKTKSSTST